MAEALDEELQKITAPGTVLLAKYRVERVLGTGGMGVVVAATHLELEETVAIKFLQSSALKNEEAAARFVREAKAAVKIKSEHVARVIDVGRLENGAPYMVMEYLEGHDLSNAPQPVAVADAVDYVIQACEAMAEAHARGIVHRDLKPANLYLTQRSDGAPIVKVLDFGISKISLPDLSGLSLTRTSAVMGSPLYMSPEQMRSARKVDHRTDIWSLGVILFELLGASPPFYATSLPELCAAIIAEPPQDLRKLRADVPPDLEKVVLRCLSKDPALRPANVADLALALAPFAPRRSKAVVERVVNTLARAGLIVESLPPPSEVAPKIEPVAIPATTSGETANTNAGWSDTSITAKSSPKPVLALVLIAVAVVSAIGIFLALRYRANAVSDVTSSAAANLTPPPSPPPEPPQPVVSESPPPTVAPIASAPLPATPKTSKAAIAKTDSKSEPAKTEPAKAEPAKPEPPPPEPPKTEPAKTAPAKKNPLDIGLK